MHLLFAFGHIYGLYISVVSYVFLSFFNFVGFCWSPTLFAFTECASERHMCHTPFRKLVVAQIECGESRCDDEILLESDSTSLVKLWTG